MSVSDANAEVVSPERGRELFAASPVALAPIAGYTDWPFQVICRTVGACPLTFTPMIGSRALAFASTRRKTLRLLDWDGSCGNIAVQLYGSEPALMAEAARVAVERGARLIDINMGCTVPKIARRGAGAMLLRHPDVALRMVESVLAAVDIPVTVKMRLGLKCGDGRGLELARNLDKMGVKALFVHARYAEQGFAGVPDVAELRRWCAELSVPVWGNGDIIDVATMRRFLSCGVAGVMVGRGALGNPWLLRCLRDNVNECAAVERDKGPSENASNALSGLLQTKSSEDSWGTEEAMCRRFSRSGCFQREQPQVRLLEGRHKVPTAPEVVDLMRKHWLLVRRYSQLTEVQTVRSFRCHLVWYGRRWEFLRPWRSELLSQSDYAGVECLLDKICDKVGSGLV